MRAADANAGTRLAPRDAAELAEIVRGHPRALEPIGGGTKRAVGRAVDADPLDLSALAGIVDYTPDELVLTAQAATPLAEIERAIAAHGQRLAFAPPDYGALLHGGAAAAGGAPANGGDAAAVDGVPAKGVRPQTNGAGAQTIGGILATNLAGSRRVVAGAARDHFLGFEAVSGRGERFKAGGRVVKNVTGYDLPKLIAGSWGTLAVLTQVTIRTAPAPETERTLLIEADSAQRAVDLLTLALGAGTDVSAAAYDPWQGAALRLEGFAESVAARAAALLEALGSPAAETLEDEHSAAFWAALSGAEALAGWPIVWRLSIPPAHAPSVLASLAPERYLLDWGGGLVWAAYASVDARRVRGALGEGHATLIKAPPAARAQTCTFHPPPASLAAALERIKRAFDPDDRLNPGRMD